MSDRGARATEADGRAGGVSVHSKEAVMSEQEEQLPKDELTRDMFADGAARPQVVEHGPTVPAPPSGSQPEAVSAMEAALASAPREELVCFTRAVLIAMRTGEPVSMRVRTEGAPRTFIVVAAEAQGGAMATPPEEKLKRLVRSLEESGRLAAELAELLLPATRADVMSFSVDLFNGATELRGLVPLIASVEGPRGNA